MADGVSWHQLKSVNGYNLAEVASAMQKEIRRSNPDAAMYWASELLISGYGNYCWKRLQIIITEDVDVLADNNKGLIADFHALYQIAMEGQAERKRKKAEKFDEREGLSLMAAVMKLAMADKSRVACNAKVRYVDMPRGELREIPDYALDRHTARGKRAGRDWDFFFTEASKLMDIRGKEVSQDDDPYLKDVWNWLNNPNKFESASRESDAREEGKLF